MKLENNTTPETHKDEGSSSFKLVDAIEFLNNSDLVAQNKFPWLTPLIKKVLVDELTQTNVSEYLSKLLKLNDNAKETEKVKVIQLNNHPQLTKQSELTTTPKRICKINKISNVGLLNLNQAIDLNAEIHVFYGKNGAGKSSIYLALCKALGKAKKVYPNINYNDENSEVDIQIESDLGEEQKIEWRTSNRNQSEINVRIYDSHISQVIVEEDQLNNFRLAFLRTEYFSYLSDLYDETESILSEFKTRISEKRNNLTEAIHRVFPDYVNIEKTLNKDQIRGSILSEEEERLLLETKGAIITLNKQDISSIKRNLENAKEKIHSFLKSLGSSTQITESINETREVLVTWNLKFSKKYYNECAEAILKIKFLQRKGEDKKQMLLSGDIPETWLRNNTWFEFIKSSISFAEQLGEIERNKYKTESCLYCLQPIQSDQARKLMSSYFELTGEEEREVNAQQDEINLKITALQKALNQLMDLSTQNNSINKDLKYIDHSLNVSFDSTQSVESISDIISKLRVLEPIELTNHTHLETLFAYYAQTYRNIELRLVSIDHASDNKQKELVRLQKALTPLQIKKSIIENREELLLLLELNESIQAVNKFIIDLSKAKQRTSSLATEYAKEKPLQLFKAKLDEEYNRFTFQPPTTFTLKSRSSSDGNRRTYRLADRKLSDILSEGERRVHSLADFFAESAIAEYSGVFIFDDPVNSLDEDNIERVAERLHELVNQGNQVIVFTHNLFFLNTLLKVDDDKLTKVSKLEHTVQIDLDVKIGSLKDIQKTFDEIKNRMNAFQNRNVAEISEFELSDVYCLISRYLEYYVENKIFCDVISRYRPNLRMNSVTKVDLNELEKLGKLAELYEQTSRKGTRHAKPSPCPAPTYDKLKKLYVSLVEEFPKPK